MKYPTIISAICAPIFALSLSSCGSKSDSTDGTSLRVNGSDTMLQVGIAWADKYKTVNPNTLITVKGDGSGTGIKALIKGTVDIAHSSRAMKESEIAQIEEAHGKKPVEHIVGYDGIAVYVHKDNPVKSLSLSQLNGIFAEGGATTNWSQVGGNDEKMNVVGRNNASGTYGFFRDTVCGKGTEYKKAVASMPGSTAVVDFCATTTSGIGYSGMGYKTDAVGWLSVSAEDGGEAYEPSIENVAGKKYPIARPLYIYTVGEPEGAVKEYLDWIKGAEGQAVLAEEKFVPLN